MILMSSILTSPEIHLQMSGEYCNKVLKTIVSIEIINVIIMVCIAGHSAGGTNPHFLCISDAHTARISARCNVSIHDKKKKKFPQ